MDNTPEEASEAHDASFPARFRTPLLLVTVLVISTAGLVYELLAGALASSRLGDSVLQFSTTIGVYLFAMGIGAYLSKLFDEKLPQRFVEVELAVALVGGLEAPVLWLAAGDAMFYRVLLYGVLLIVGTLVGLEIPLLMRILQSSVDLKNLVARVLSFDYLGALVGSVLFAVVLVPSLGMIRTSLVFGTLSASVGIASTWILKDSLSTRASRRLYASGFFVLALLVAGVIGSPWIERFGESELYDARIVYATQTAYQRIVVTEGRGGFQLHLNGNLQFNSVDEYRYHEALVHPAFAATPRHARVLVLGGGDGLAVREVLRYRDVAHVTLIDLDPGMTRLAQRAQVLRGLNRGSLNDPRVRVVNEDAMVWLDQRARDAKFDIVIADFPDPNNYSVGKLYTARFYALLKRVMTDESALVVQATSPLFARKSFWCIDGSMRAAGFSTHAYHALVPSFGEWGYVLARTVPFEAPRSLAIRGLRFLDDPSLAAMFVFSADMSRVPTEVNRLNDQALVRYYESEWGRYE